MRIKNKDLSAEFMLIARGCTIERETLCVVCNLFTYINKNCIRLFTCLLDIFSVTSLYLIIFCEIVRNPEEGKI